MLSGFVGGPPHSPPLRGVPTGGHMPTIARAHQQPHAPTTSGPGTLKPFSRSTNFLTLSLVPFCRGVCARERGGGNFAACLRGGTGAGGPDPLCAMAETPGPCARRPPQPDPLRRMSRVNAQRQTYAFPVSSCAKQGCGGIAVLGSSCHGRDQAEALPGVRRRPTACRTLTDEELAGHGDNGRKRSVLPCARVR